MGEGPKKGPEKLSLSFKVSEFPSFSEWKGEGRRGNSVKKIFHSTFPVTKTKLRLYEILWDEKICRAKHWDVKIII